MAQVGKKGNLANVRGKFGNQIVARRWGKKTIIQQAPGKRTRKPGKVQKEKEDKFKVGAKYAKWIHDHPASIQARGYLAVLKKGTPLFRRALRDFLTAPKILAIDIDRYQGHPGDTINVQAIDDFQVEKVRVEIYTSEGVLLEAGLAPYNEVLTYKYTATLENTQLRGARVKAIATDLPGGEGIKEVTL